MSAKRPGKSHSDLAANLDHVLYEMEMLLAAAYNASLRNDGRIQNAWLEVFAIHARNLNEFFGRSGVDFDLMHARDFVGGLDTGYVWDENLHTRASQQVAHLTFDREWHSAKTPWDIPGILNRLKQPCQRFLAEVRNRRYLSEYRKNGERISALLAQMNSLTLGRHWASANTADNNCSSITLEPPDFNETIKESDR